MKVWIIIFLIGIVFVVLFFPVVNSQRLCYEVSRKEMDETSSKVFNQRITQEMQCSQNMDILFNLETCIQESTKSSVIALYINDTITRTVAIIRPYSKNLWSLKEDHNTACKNYSWNQLP